MWKCFLNFKNRISWQVECLTGKLAHLYEYFNSIDDYQKPVDNLKKVQFFSKLTDDYPIDEEIKGTKKPI